MKTSLNQLKFEIRPFQEKLLQHPINNFLNDLKDLERFMQFHAFAVWDFMSLVKKLQIEFTCTSLPWKPVGNPQTRRLINEIVFGEESDVDLVGKPCSHFELYVQAMRELGINILPELNDLLQSNDLSEVIQSIHQVNLDLRLKKFLLFTFESIEKRKLHEIAAIFTFGREDLIPSMFTKIVDHLRELSIPCDTLLYYLDRHIEVDGDSHAHLAYEMMNELCGDDQTKWDEATLAAKESLQVRILLWDSIVNL